MKKGARKSFMMRWLLHIFNMYMSGGEGMHLIRVRWSAVYMHLGQLKGGMTGWHTCSNAP